MASKIAVIGSVDGQLSAVFGKLAALHSKNSFSFALVVGELFAAENDESGNAQIEQLLVGKIEVPVTTYFALGKRLLPDQIAERLQANSGELCENLYILGRRTTVKTSEGVRIVALGGAYNGEVLEEKTSLNEFSPAYTDADVKVLKGANSADILVTNDWPVDIRTGSKVTLPDDSQPLPQQSVADLCNWLKPRYHFTTSTVFYEREPFFHAREADSEEYRITRFISLATYGNPSKQKWIYAFSLDPSAAQPVTVPTGTTASPLSFSSKKRKAPLEPQPFSRYSNGTSHHQGGRGKRSRQPPPTPQECFFCLSNPNLATHLITSIGENAYVTTAKGPLSTPSTYPALDFPGHMLIIPLSHSPTLSSISDTDSRAATVKEMHRYRTALQDMVSSCSASAAEKDKLGAVTWEISRAGGIHVHWQFLPVPASMVARGLVEAAFKVEGENEKYPAFSSGVAYKPDAVVAEELEDFLKVTIWAPGKEERVMLLRLDPSFRFDLQFGRKVLAKLLGLEARMDWRDCGQSEAEEARDAEAFKEAFKEFDFALED